MPPKLPRRRPSSSSSAGRSHPIRIAVLGDLMLDVVLAPSVALANGSDVPGRVSLRQGGSAANTARWTSRLGARTTLVCAIGRDREGRALVASLSGDGVRVRAARVTGARTGRIGVLVAPGGERSFVADRGAADHLDPGQLRPEDLRVDALHLPAYSLLGSPLGEAGRHAIDLARASGALVSLDLASVQPLLARGRRAAIRLVREARPDILFATEAELDAIAGRGDRRTIGAIAPIGVIKRGRAGARVVAGPPDQRIQFDVATTPLEARDTTGAGDAFDAGFLVSWLSVEPDARHRPAGLRRAVLAGHRAAARQLTGEAKELTL
jgi:ribokinase